MCAQKIKKRKIPLSAGWAAVLSLISFSFITGGVFIAYPAVRDLISGRSGPIGSMICIAGSLVPFVLGWLTLRASRQGIGDRIAFEDASATTIARINDRGRAQRKDSYGRTFYTYWVTAMASLILSSHCWRENQGTLRESWTSTISYCTGLC